MTHLLIKMRSSGSYNGSLLVEMLNVQQQRNGHAGSGSRTSLEN